jgi:hypothetical protein
MAHTAMKIDPDEQSDDGASWARCCCCTPHDEHNQIVLPEPRRFIPSDASSDALTLIEIQSFTLPIEYNAKKEYVRQFTRGDSFDDMSTPRRTLSVNMTVDLINEARNVLLMAMADTDTEPKSARVSPRDLTRHITVYEHAIAQEKDMAKKAIYIEEYEMFKGALFVDNIHDAEKARLYTSLVESRKQGPSDKLMYFRKAIMYTNDIHDKEVLMQRYIAYCEQLKDSTVT